ncbi:MAG: hypothetical protein AAGF12_11635 [Myxococcota bacterium]
MNCVNATVNAGPNRWPICSRAGFTPPLRHIARAWIQPLGWWLALGAVGICGGFSEAQAQEEEPEAGLDYAADPGCPSEEEFRDLVLARLGRMPFRAPNGDDWVIEVRLRREGGAFEAHIAATGERNFESNSCDDLAEAAAVVVALALEAGPPESTEMEAPGTELPSRLGASDWRSELSPEARAALEALAHEEPPREEVPLAVEERRAPVWEVAIRAEVLGSLGVVPGVAMGGLVGLDLAHGWFRLGIEVLAEGSLASHADEEVRGVVIIGGLSPCVVLAPVFGCVVGNLGITSSRAEQVVNPQWETSFVASGALRLGLEHTMDGFRIHGAIEAWLPFNRVELLVGDRVVWDPSPVAGRLHLGGSWILP